MNRFSACLVRGPNRAVLAALAVAGLLAGAAGVLAAGADQISSNALLQIQALMAEKATRTPAQQKMDSQLIYALKQERGQPFAAGVTSLRLDAKAEADGRFLVDITAEVTRELLERITNAGGQVVNSVPQFQSLRALLPLSQTETLAGMPGVRFIRPAMRGLTRTGSVDSEGDITHRAAEARQTFGADGTGVKVGVLSDSVDLLAQAQATGDLPANVTILPGQSGIPGSGEGTAMLEIVYDLAPGAQLFFATGSSQQTTEAQFAQNILDLRAAGCDIIVDDIFYFDESPFQDSIVTRAVNSVTASGALYFSAAGNEGSEKHGTSGTWEGDFADGGPAGSPVNGKGGNLHLFGTTAYDTVTKVGMSTILLWSDPLGVSTNDYDLYVLDSSGANVVSSSTTTQNGTQDPFEQVRPPNVGERVVVVKASGTGRFLHIDTIRGQLAINTHGNVTGHCTATNAFACAAVDVHTAFPNAFSGGAANPVESFSTDGPRRVFYNADGTAITPGDFSSTGGFVRQKPDIAAADGVSTTLPRSSGLNPFFGTSAAAPHAAAIGALLKSFNPTLTPAQMRTILTGTALDNEAPGVDENSGWGIVMAYQALAAAPPLPLPSLVLQTNLVTGGNGNGLIDPDECNLLYLVLTNQGNAAATTVRATLTSTTPGVIVMQPFSLYPDMPVGTGATNLTGFKITTSPNLVCGTPFAFHLVLKSDQVVRTNQLQIPTGLLGTPLRFNDSFPYVIPDNNSNGVSSPIFVSGITGTVAKVAVGLNILHNSDSDLTLELIAPDGTTNILAAHVGAGGHNFGAGCTPDSNLTIFDDAATLSITNGTPPFVGSFQPQQPLAVYSGKTGFAVNGLWQLHIVDNVPLNAGVLECWSLFLTPVLCTDGGGQCPGVDLAVGMTDIPDPSIVGSNLTYTITVTNNGPNVAHGVVVAQNLPGSVLFVSASVSQGSASQSGGVVTATLGNLAAGASATITVVVLPTQAGTIFSSANVTSTDPELDPSNNSVSIATSVFPPVADLAVGLAAAPNPTIVGGTLTYTVSVTNTGPATASGVVLSNTLPLTVLINSASSSQGSIVIAGNVVICNVGLLFSGGRATATINVTPQAYGTIYATASASALQPDPFLANNTVTLATGVGQAADVAVSIVDTPDPVVLTSNLTYVITATNSGPNTATNVVVTQILPVGATVLSVTVSQGTTNLSSGSLVCNLGTLTVGRSATITVKLKPTNTGTLNTTATITAGQADPNPANNSATASTLVALPFISILPAGDALVFESGPTNGAIDVGETVTVSLRLRNAGNVNNTNLVATLLATNGVSPAPTNSPQTYGVLPPGGAPVGESFTFTAAGSYGASIVAPLHLVDGTNDLGTVGFPFVLPNLSTFANPNYITIRDTNAALPYPSTINVSGLTGLVGNVTVTLSNMSHTFPQDVDVLLVGPDGQNTILMSGAGAPPLANANVTFDDSAPTPVPDGSSQILSGSYRPADYLPGTNLPPPAPAGPYPAAMSVFDAINPNGTWSLFVDDHTAGDSGNIAGGWSLSFTTITPVNQLADLGLTATATPNPVRVGSPLTCTFVITNNGPNTANGVLFTNSLPANVNLASVSVSQGSASTNGSLVTGSLGSLSAGAAAIVTVVMVPTAAGLITVPANAVASEVDIDPANNAATAAALAVLPVADLGVLATGPAQATAGRNLTYSITVTNNGPETAPGIVVSDPLPAGVNFVSANPAVGTAANVNGIVVWNLGTLVAGLAAHMDLVVTPTLAGTTTNLVALQAPQVSDTNALNDSASVLTVVTNPAPALVAAGATLTSESFAPPNGVIDPGETVSLLLALANSGTADTTNLVATLLATGGVQSPSAPQTYGLVVAGGSPVARSFTFTDNPANTGPVVATLQLADGAHNLGSVTFVFTPPLTGTFSNSAAIIIPAQGAGQPYPSLINVSGLTGVVTKVTVTLSNLSHTFPSDIDVLLVSPAGQKVDVMSSCGGSYSVTNLELTFDDAAASLLPTSSRMVSGTFRPSNYAPNGIFPGPAPAGPTGSALAAFTASAPNGSWSLYVFDHSPGDSGSIASGWSLTLTAANTVNPVADVGLTLTATPATVLTYEPITYTLSVMNAGPATATNVIVTDTLPAAVGFTSALLSQGTYSIANGVVTCNLGSLTAGSSANITLLTLSLFEALATNVATVTASQTDLDPANNTAQSVTTILNPIPAVLSGAYIATNGNFQITLLGQRLATYDLQASTNFASWFGIYSDAASSAGVIEFTDTNAPNYLYRFYRAVRIP